MTEAPGTPPPCPGGPLPSAIPAPASSAAAGATDIGAPCPAGGNGGCGVSHGDTFFELLESRSAAC
ncbi:hypothetical protein AB0899_20175 [Streptomyces sp. NPDC007002]|uniref:hypothetical protein n=1 Tax=Streptomyces sp. NPDC007002 TaxID=3156910 RepID=UPI003452E768